MKKNIPEIREREGNEKIHSHNSGMGIRGFHSWEWRGTGIPAHPWFNSPPKFFCGRTQKLVKHWIFYTILIHLLEENQRNNDTFWTSIFILFGQLIGNDERYWDGPRPNDVYMHRGPNAFWAKIGCGAVLTLFWCPKWGDCDKMLSVSKNLRC